MSRNSRQNARRSRARISPRTPIVPQRRTLLFEALERRELLAGGLPYQLINSSQTVEVYSSDPHVDFSGNSSDSTSLLTSFFNATSGTASSTTFAGNMTVGGETISGTFTLSEISASGGIDVQVTSASLTFGSGAGVQLSNASGAFELLPAGAAGVLNAGGTADSVSVSGLLGLGLSTTSTGLTFEVNETGSPVNDTVGSTAIDIPTSQALDLSGPAAFQILKESHDAQGHLITHTLATIGGQFSMTPVQTGGLSLSGTEVSVDLYTGTTRAVSLGSASASFTLNSSGLALVANSYTVGSFHILPSGTPDTPGSGSYPSTAASTSANLGPISLENLSPTLSTLSFGPTGLNANVGLSADSASLTFSTGTSSDSGDSAPNFSATTLAGTFSIQGTSDPDTGNIASIGLTGGFSLTADSLSLDIPKLLTASASGLAITYDPSQTGPQQIFSAESFSVTVPKLNLTADFTPSDSNPGLTVSTDGFTFGKGTVTKTGKISLGSSTKFSVVNPYATLDDFTFKTDTGTGNGFSVSLGGFAVGAKLLSLEAPSSHLDASGTNISGSVTFDTSGAVSDVTFKAETMTANISPLVTLSGSNVTFIPTATNAQTILSANSLTATLTVSAIGLTISGNASDVTLSADGQLTGPSSLTVSTSFNSDTIADKLKLPKILSLNVESLNLYFPTFETDPTDVKLKLSASVDTKIGPVSLSGSVSDLEIDPNRLSAGKFPLTGVGTVSVSASGDLFGGTIKGTLAAGVVKTDVTGQLLPNDATDPFNTVFWAGVEGSFKFGNIGASIYVGFTQNGLLSAYLNAEVPIILDPTSGLELDGFRGGVSFNALSLPDPTDPSQLNAPVFEPTSSLTRRGVGRPGAARGHQPGHLRQPPLLHRHRPDQHHRPARFRHHRTHRLPRHPGQRQRLPPRRLHHLHLRHRTLHRRHPLDGLARHRHLLHPQEQRRQPRCHRLQLRHHRQVRLRPRSRHRHRRLGLSGPDHRLPGQGGHPQFLRDRQRTAPGRGRHPRPVAGGRQRPDLLPHHSGQLTPKPSSPSPSRPPSTS